MIMLALARYSNFSNLSVNYLPMHNYVHSYVQSVRLFRAIVAEKSCVFVINVCQNCLTSMICSCITEANYRKKAVQKCMYGELRVLITMRYDTI